MVVFAIGLFAVPQTFADHDEVTIENAAGSASNTDCGADCFIPNPVTVHLGTVVTWANTRHRIQLIQQLDGTPADGPSGVFDSPVWLWQAEVSPMSN